MAWAWALVMVAAVAIMVYAVWNFQKKTAAREAAAQQRFASLLGGQASGSARPAPAYAPVPASHTAPVAPAAPGAAIPPAAAPAPAAAAVTAQERFLGQHQTLLYLLLKTGLPDHEIFANVSLAAITAQPAGGGEREQQLRRLAPYQLDFVVCDKSMRVIAAVDFEAAGGADAAGIQQFKADYLKRAGIRLVRVNPAAMPKRDQVRGLVVGGGPAPA